ncbi:MAG TPA: hypothetical protein VF096_08170 [Azonexus sp.]
MSRSRQPQRGMILLGLMVVLAIAAGLLLLQRANSAASGLDREAKTSAQLLAAREALLARAVLDANRPGSLPCPDLDDDGIADLAWPNCTAYVGRLPWRTLDLNDPRGAAGEGLWYVLSPNFRDGNAAINGTTAGTLWLDGQGDIAALVIAPGGALTGQARPSANPADYLDDANGNPATSNRDGDDRYFSGPAGADFNDRVIALDRRTLLATLTPRILGDIRQAVRAAGGALPFADSDGDGLADAPADSGRFPFREAAYDLPSPTWTAERWYAPLVANNWFPLVAYDRAAAVIVLNGKKMDLP